MRRLGRYCAAGVGAGLGAYAAWAGLTWLRFGKLIRRRDGHDRTFDHLMPWYEVEERHAIRVSAPAAVALAAMLDSDLEDPALARIIVRARELLLGTRKDERPLPHGLLRKAQAMGWGILSQSPHRTIVGAVTQPWEANVVFHPLPPGEFPQFHQPDFVKIAWTIGVTPVTGSECLVHTETRVQTTSAWARRKFRLYWAFVSPGIKLIRHALLLHVKRLAERRYAAVPPWAGAAWADK